MSRVRPLPAAVPTAPLRVNASLPLMIRLEELVRFDRVVRDPAHVEELHDMRIAAKRLRYTLEVFSPAIDGAAGYLKVLRALQEHLGRIHDTDVLIDSIEGAPEPGDAAVQAVAKVVRAERDRLYREFIEAWDASITAGFAARLWRAVGQAQGDGVPKSDGIGEPDSGPPPTARALPRGRARKLEMARALLRLAPFATDAAAGERRAHLKRLALQLQTALDGPYASDRAWKRLCRELARQIGESPPTEAGSEA